MIFVVDRLDGATGFVCAKHPGRSCWIDWGRTLRLHESGDAEDDSWGQEHFIFHGVSLATKYCGRTYSNVPAWMQLWEGGKQ